LFTLKLDKTRKFLLIIKADEQYGKMLKLNLQVLYKILFLIGLKMAVYSQNM